MDFSRERGVEVGGGLDLGRERGAKIGGGLDLGLERERLRSVVIWSKSRGRNL